MILKSAPSMAVIFTALTMLGLISALLSLSGAETSVTPFKLKYTNDWIILFFILSLLTTSATFVTLSIKKKGLNKFVNYFGSYITVMTLADVVGLFNAPIGKKSFNRYCSKNGKTNLWLQHICNRYVCVWDSLGDLSHQR